MAEQIRFKVYVKERERPLSIAAEEYDTAADFTRFYTRDRLVAVVPTPMLVAITSDPTLIASTEDQMAAAMKKVIVAAQTGVS